MKYLHVLLAFATEPWAMQREKLELISRFLVFKADGGELTAEEVRARIGKGQERAIARQEGTVAVLPMVGVISQRMGMMSEVSGGASSESIARQFRSLLAEPKVKAIILDVDSPGGTVAGTEELAREIHASRGVKPIIAQVNALAASAAYWLASQADEIVVSPSGQAGSIGVYTIHDDVSAALEKMGIKKTIISGPEDGFKGEANAFQPLSEEARANIQKGVNRATAMFEAAVARGRGVSLKVVRDKFGSGRMFGAEELVDRGMADKVASMSETLERFGIQLNPTASKAMSRTNAQSMSAEALVHKLKAGVRPSVREWEHGLKGLVGLSNSEAERAVRECLLVAPGEPEKKAEVADTRAVLDQISEGLAALRSTLTPVTP